MATAVKHRRPTAKQAASDGGVVLLSRNCHSAAAGWKSAAVVPICGEAVLMGLSAAANGKIRPRLNNMLPRILFFICRVPLRNLLGKLISANDPQQRCV